MKEIDIMIFDFDGTLVNSGNDLAISINHMLESLHLKPLDHLTIKTYIGDGVHKLVERSIGKKHRNAFDEGIKIFTAYYEKHMCDTTKLYSGVNEVLKHFKDKKKIILTNKIQSYTLNIARHLRIDIFFDDIIGADRTDFRKPDRRILTPVLEKYNISNNKAVVIGDGVNDLMLARNTGTISCAFLNGLTSKEILLNLKPDFACEKIIMIKDFFK